MADINYFAEKKKIYRLLAVAMAEDEKANDDEIMAIVAVLLYKYYFDEIKDIAEYVEALGGKVDDSLFKMTNIISFEYPVGDKHKILNEELKNLLFHLLKNYVKDPTNAIESLPTNVDKDKLTYLLWCILLNEESSQEELLVGCNLDMSYYPNLVNYAEEILKPLCKIYLRICLSCELAVRKCLEELRDEESSTAKSIFMNVDSLDSETIKKELKEMVYVIKSDESVMDREREAFRVICKIFKIKRSAELWRELNEWDRADLLSNKDYSIKRKSLNVNDYGNIIQAISLFEIKGVLIEGAYHVLLRNEMRKEEMMYKQDRKMSGWAIALFAMSALMLYFYVADLLHQPVERNMIFNTGVLCASTKSFLGNLRSHEAFTYLAWGSMIALLGTCILRYLYLSIRCKKNRNAYSLRLKRFKNVICKIIITGLVLGTLYFIFFVVFKSPYGIFLETFFIPITLMIMMLSIEWLIFMRQEYSSLAKDSKDISINNNGENGTVLIVLVFAAILTDMCLGIVELVGEDISLMSEELIGKLASALILGCICFFAGKFLDMHRMQQQTDMIKMKKCIKELENRIKKGSKSIKNTALYTSECMDLYY